MTDDRERTPKKPLIFNIGPHYHGNIDQQNVIHGGKQEFNQLGSRRNQPFPSKSQLSRKYYVRFVAVVVIVLIGAGIVGAIYVSHPPNLGLATSTHFNVKQPTPTHSLVAAPTGTPSNVGDLNLTWSQQSSAASRGRTIGSVAWSSSLLLFVAVGDQDHQEGVILTSPDKSHWTVQSNSWPVLHSIVWSGSLFVVVGDAGLILTSLNGKDWKHQQVGTNALYNVAWSGSLFVAVGAAGTILTSLYGKVWNSQDSQINGGEPLYGNGGSSSHFVAVGGGYNTINSGVILTSPDGSAWASQLAPYELNNVAWSVSRFVVVGGYTIKATGSSAWIILTSPDGKTWTTQGSGSGYQLIDIAWSGKFFVAVGSNGTIIASYDGRTWTSPQTLPPSVLSKNLYGVTWTGTFFVAVGADGTVLTSS